MKENGKTGSSMEEVFFGRKIFRDKEFGKTESEFNGLMKQRKINKKVSKRRKVKP